MIDKKETTLKGALIYPLVLGSCALIVHRGRLMRTSRVVAIHSQTADELCFETLNTRYTLLMDPSPETAACPGMMGMAA